MITNTNNLGSIPSPISAAPRPNSARSAPPLAASVGDSLSTSHASRLQAALAQTPALRAEVIDRVTPLATDPTYPSPAILGKIGQLLARSKDPSQQED